jgi:hypothetical protein
VRRSSAAIALDLVEGLLPGFARIAVRLESGAPLTELSGLLIGERRRRRVEAIPELLGELDTLGGAQVGEVEERVGHGRNLESGDGVRQEMRVDV